MNPTDYLQYGALGLLALILTGGGYGLFKLGQILVDRLVKAFDAHTDALKDVHAKHQVVIDKMHEHDIADQERHTVTLEKLALIGAEQESLQDTTKELRREVRTALHAGEISGDLAPIRGAKG